MARQCAIDRLAHTIASGAAIGLARRPALVGVASRRQLCRRRHVEAGECGAGVSRLARQSGPRQSDRTVKPYRLGTIRWLCLAIARWQEGLSLSQPAVAPG